jgi:hypothetical protein
MDNTISFSDFLDAIPPYTKVTCSGLFKNIRFHMPKLDESIRPQIYCGNEPCKSRQFFHMLNSTEQEIKNESVSTNKVIYQCSNCQETIKTFFIRFSMPELELDECLTDNTPIEVEKIGEYPKYGKPIPPQALKLIGSERDLFFKGNSCENMGLGIGAFSYYRRVIDAKKDKIFDEIIKVLKLKEGNEELIKELTQAKQETQFTKAFNKVKKALPDSLNINGYNPLELLYKALSEGLHNHTDEVCLEYAQAIKVVLFELTIRLNDALKEDKVVVDALKFLVKKKV